MFNQAFSIPKIQKLLNHAFQNEDEKKWTAMFHDLLNKADIKKGSQIEGAIIRIRALNRFEKRLQECLKVKSQDEALQLMDKHKKIVQLVDTFISHLLQANPEKWKIIKQAYLPNALHKNLNELSCIFQLIYSAAEQFGKVKIIQNARFNEVVASSLIQSIKKVWNDKKDLQVREKFIKQIVNNLANNRFEQLPQALNLNHYQFNKDFQTIINKLNPTKRLEQNIEWKGQITKSIESSSKKEPIKDEIIKLRAQLTKKDKEALQLNACLKNYLRQTDDLKKKQYQLQTQKTTIQKDIQRLNKLVKDYNKDGENKQYAQKMYEQQKRKVKQLNEKSDAINVSLQSIVIQLNGKNTNNSPQILEVIGQIKTLILNLQNEKQIALQSNKTLNIQKEKIQQEVQSLKNAISNTRKNTQDSQTQHEEYKKRINQLKNQLQMEKNLKESNIKEKEEIIAKITQEKYAISNRRQEQAKLSKENSQQKQRQISLLTQENNTLRINNKTLNDKQSQHIQCNRQLKADISTINKKLKCKQEEYQSLQGEFNAKNAQIEVLSYSMEQAKEQLKNLYENKISELEGQLSLKDSEIQELRNTNKDLQKNIQIKESSIRELRKAKEEQSNIRKISDISKVPLEMKEQVRKKIEEHYQCSIMQLRKKYIMLYQQKYSKFHNKSIQDLGSVALMYIEQLFSHELLQTRIDLKFRILTHLFSFNNKTVAKTRLVFKFDPQNATNFHKYIDGKANLICIAKTVLGAFVASYYSGVYEQSIMTQPGLLISITNNDSYELFPSQNRANSRTMVYDPYFLIFGNAQFRIRSGERNIFCNFGIMNSYFNHRNKKVHDFLCAGNERETEMETYEIYEIMYQDDNESERQKRLLDRQ